MSTRKRKAPAEPCRSTEVAQIVGEPSRKTRRTSEKAVPREPAATEVLATRGEHIATTTEANVNTVLGNKLVKLCDSMSRLKQETHHILKANMHALEKSYRDNEQRTNTDWTAAQPSEVMDKLEYLETKMVVMERKMMSNFDFIIEQIRGVAEEKHNEVNERFDDIEDLIKRKVNAGQTINCFYK